MLARGMESPYAEWLENWGDDRPDPGARVTTRVQCAEWFDVRDRALIAHETQIDPTSRWFTVPTEMQREIWPTEDYELVRSLVDTAGAGGRPVRGHRRARGRPAALSGSRVACAREPVLVACGSRADHGVVLAQDPQPPPGQGPEFGKASPIALVVIILLGHRAGLSHPVDDQAPQRRAGELRAAGGGHREARRTERLHV